MRLGPRAVHQAPLAFVIIALIQHNAAKRWVDRADGRSRTRIKIRASSTQVKIRKPSCLRNSKKITIVGCFRGPPHPTVPQGILRQTQHPAVVIAWLRRYQSAEVLPEYSAEVAV